MHIFEKILSAILSSSRFEPLTLTSDFRQCLTLLENTDASYFITGKAGTGKSTLLQLFKDTTRKKVVVVAPTGIAALNVRGQTIHSFFSFPPYPLNRKQIHRLSNHQLYKRMEMLVIDEISMVRADLLDQIDVFLRINRGKEEPFGGVQVVFFGDLYQLPPVLATQTERDHLSQIYETPYFYSAKVFRDGFDVRLIELHHVYRQAEFQFIQLLDRVRTRDFDQDDLDLINERAGTMELASDFVITLSSTNRIADQINTTRLMALGGKSYQYQAVIEGEFNPKSYPTDSLLVLKEGAQVMFVRNDPAKEFVNGSIGRVTGLEHDRISVCIEKEAGTKVLEITPLEWQMVRYRLNAEKELEAEVTGLFRQYPIRLAWAVTIHKSQGKTFDRIRIDLGRGAFEFGQTYVALSRCRTLEGIHLSRPLLAMDILVDQRVTEFYDAIRKVKLAEYKPWARPGIEGSSLDLGI